jgi:hypothetical protein
MKDVCDISPDGVVEREATADELAAREEVLEAYNARIAKEETDATAKAALLNRLGITAEEAALLLA